MSIIYRPESFDELKGHKRIKEYFIERINSDTLSNFYIIYGEEGLGKNTLANLVGLGAVCEAEVKPCGRCPSCVDTIQNVIRDNKDTERIKRFVMSEDGSHQTAMEVLANLNTNFLENGKSVLFIDEVHRMDAKAQDALLNKFEYIPSDVIVIMTTTDVLKIHKQLLSRAVEINLNRLATNEILSAMKAEVNRRNLQLQGGDSTLNLIASWADNKPRKALKVIEGLGNNSDVKLDVIKMLISFIEIGEVMPILTSLKGSFLKGIEAVSNLPISPSTRKSLVVFFTEAVKLSKGIPSSKFSREDVNLIREAIEGLDTMVLVRFLYMLTDTENLTSERLLAIYLKCHPSLSKVTGEESYNFKTEELDYMSRHGGTIDGITPSKNKAESVDAILNKGKVMVDVAAPTMAELLATEEGD